MKQRNPRWGGPRIAQQITLAFGVEIDKEVVRWSQSATSLTLETHHKDQLWRVLWLRLATLNNSKIHLIDVGFVDDQRIAQNNFASANLERAEPPC
jgi:hypothetical protein